MGIGTPLLLAVIAGGVAYFVMGRQLGKMEILFALAAPALALLGF